jgi:hypothetical protein
LRSRVTFLGADVQVITCNQISEHSVDEPGRTSRPKSAGAWSGMLPSDPERAKSRRGPNTRFGPLRGGKRTSVLSDVIVING